MSNLAKVFIVLNFVLSIVFLASAGVLLAKTDEWRKKFEDEVAERKVEVTTLSGRVSQMNTQLVSVTGDRDQLKGGLGEAETARNKYQQDWQAEQGKNNELRKSLEEMSQTLKTIETTLASSQEQVAALQKAKEESETSMREAVDKQRVAEAEVTRLRSEGDDKGGQIEKLGMQLVSVREERDKLQTLVDMASEAGFDMSSLMAQPAINGRVVEVDPHAGVVVLSVGAQAGVKKGYTLHVYRGGDYVGMVMVDDVYPDLSAASIVKLRPNMEVRKLDEVSTRL